MAAACEAHCRLCTVQLSVSCGGAAVAPSAIFKRQNSCVNTTLHVQSAQGLAVKATRGDALLFYSLKPNGETDPTSMHGSCPTLKARPF